MRPGFPPGLLLCVQALAFGEALSTLFNDGVEVWASADGSLAVRGVWAALIRAASWDRDTRRSSGLPCADAGL